ncbi:Arp2/3 complex subunit, actin nucleation center [Endocarpon pusillum]|uniref:Arp2/3 complex subunit, actin nucleation center n=1 Tax=Endocarpon pusillum TaxID=364733 RepID=A0A8H7ADA9_9EURO|nr:Arp2/3 complex subunit, actin nucleation center [Endocarpon pusillum]
MGSYASAPPMHPGTTLEGRVALITGAGRGLGAGLALELASRGASVVLNYARSAKAAQGVVAEIESQAGSAVAIQADISKVSEVTKLFDAAMAHFGRLDIVINNAGMESFANEEDVTEEMFDEVFGLNTRAQFFVAQHGLKHLSRGGRIIFMSSVAATMSGVANHALYAGSKAAVEGFTRSFSADAGPKGITVNAIAPGGIKTDMFSANAWHYSPGADPNTSIEEIEKGIASLCPLGRCAVPADVARVVAFLGSADSEWINGQVIKLSGGSIA